MVMNVEVPPFVDVRVIGDLRGAPAICFQLDLVLREIEEGEVGLGLPPPVQRVLPGWVTFWRRSCCGPQFVLGHALTTFLCCRSAHSRLPQPELAAVRRCSVLMGSIGGISHDGHVHRLIDAYAHLFARALIDEVTGSLENPPRE